MTRISKIQIKEQADRNMLTVRKIINFYPEYSNFMNDTTKNILDFLREQNVFPCSGPIVCFHNIELEKLDIEVGFEIANRIAPIEGLELSTIPPQLVATTIDLGPYEKQDPTLEELMKWIPQNGYQAVGGIYYHYLNDEEQANIHYLTEMFIPVKKQNS